MVSCRHADPCPSLPPLPSWENGAMAPGPPGSGSWLLLHVGRRFLGLVFRGFNHLRGDLAAHGIDLDLADVRRAGPGDIERPDQQRILVFQFGALDLPAWNPCQ